MSGEILSIENFGYTNTIEKTQLASNAVSAATSVSVLNTQGLGTNDYIVINPGAENSELRKITGVTSTIALSALTLSHTKNEQVIKVRGNQIKLYRADNVDGSIPSDGSFTSVATVNLDVDQQQTVYTDSVGGSSYWYRYSYYNDISLEETSLSDAIRGGDFNRYASIDQVKTEAGLKNNRYITDAQVLEAIEEAEGQVKASLAMGGYSLPLSEVPYLIRHVTKQLAAGYLLTNSYGSQHTGTEKDGDMKIKRAVDILEKIEKGKVTLVVPPADEAVTPTTTTIAGYPDNTAGDNSEDAKFTMNQVW